MVEDWSDTTLGEVMTLQRGFDLPEAERRLGMVPVVASNGVVGWHSEAAVPGPGVVIGRSGSIGGGQYLREDFWPLNTTLWVKDFKGNEPRYCYYLLRSLDFSRFNAGSGVPTLNRNHIHPLPVRKAPGHAQLAISEALGALDDKIDVNRRTSKTLEELARALFKSWFVDFDPVHAKACGRIPAGMGAATARLFPSRFVETTEGRVPEGWEASTTGHVFEVVGGSTPSTLESRFWEGGTHAWATPKDLSKIQSHVLIDTERRITELGVSAISSGLLPPGTVLLSSRAPVGYLAIAEMPVAINQGFIAMRANERVTSQFLLYWADAHMPLIESRASGTTFPEISKKNFRLIPMVIPPPALVHRFDEIARHWHRRVVISETESRTLAELRDTLLPKLLSGEVRFQNVGALPGEDA